MTVLSAVTVDPVDLVGPVDLVDLLLDGVFVVFVIAMVSMSVFTLSRRRLWMLLA